LEQGFTKDEVERATRRWRIFASGLRNPNGLSWEPESHTLWAVVNKRDEIDMMKSLGRLIGSVPGAFDSITSMSPFGNL
jgi:uncharacterized protein YjiK